LLDTAFEQIRQYSQSDVAVSLRLLRAFNDIAQTVSDTESRAMLLQRASRVVTGCAPQLSEESPRQAAVSALRRSRPTSWIVKFADQLELYHSLQKMHSSHYFSASPGVFRFQDIPGKKVFVTVHSLPFSDSATYF
jgi:hypothetical protein